MQVLEKRQSKRSHLVRNEVFRKDAIWSLYRTFDEEQAGMTVDYPANWVHLRDVRNSFENYGRLVIEKSRRMMLSWTAAGWALLRMKRQPGMRVNIYSMNELAAQEFMEKIKFLENGLPKYVRTGWWHSSMSAGTLLNGSKVVAFSSAKEAGKGSGAALSIVDEAAYILYLKEQWSNIIVGVGSGGQVILISTPGRIPQGIFYELRQEPEKYNFHLIELDWDMVPGRDEDWLQNRKAEMLATGDISDFEREYLRMWNAPGGKILLTLPRIYRGTNNQNNCPLTLGLDVHTKKAAEVTWVRWEETQGHVPKTTVVGQLSIPRASVQKIVHKIEEYEEARGWELDGNRIVDPATNVDDYLGEYNAYDRFAEYGMSFMLGKNKPFKQNVLLLREVIANGAEIGAEFTELQRELREWSWHLTRPDQKADRQKDDKAMSYVYALQYNPIAGESLFYEGDAIDQLPEEQTERLLELGYAKEIVL